MKSVSVSFTLVFGFFIATSTCAFDLDEKLALIQRVHGLRAKQCESPEGQPSDARTEAGRILFNSKALSGNRDISCASCHLDQFGSADGLPIAVGVGAEGEGPMRMSSREGVLVQRNALPLLGRGHPGFTAFFWDGKVQVVDDRIVTQFGEHAFGKFDSGLAAAATLPLIERDEFLGQTHPLEANDLQRAVGDTLYYRRYEAVGAALRARFSNSEHAADREVSAALQGASLDLATLELADLGNLIAAFISIRFACPTSRWDRYLAGDRVSLSETEKRGAVLFFGKGRCAACHRGEMFSDFDYHSIGVPQGRFGPHTRHRDIGRAGVTNRREDLYKFRTPPLVSVSQTAPYGHNGMFETLEAVVVHHFNPLAFYRVLEDVYVADYFIIGKLLDSRDSVLSTIDIGRNEEVAELVAFLRTL